MTSCHYVIFYVFLSQNGVYKETYAAKRAEKLKEIQRVKRVTISWKRDTIWEVPEALIRHKENVSRLVKRDTIRWNPNSVSCSTRWKRVTIHLKRDTIWSKFCAYLSWSLFQKQGLRIEESKVQFWDYKTAKKGDFSILPSVCVCFNSSNDYVICKHHYE